MLELLPENNFWSLDFGNSSKVFIKPFLQRVFYTRSPAESHLLYAADIDEAGTVLGIGLSVRHAQEYGSDPLPFVGYNRTYAGYQNRGLGLRRLMALNQACKAIYAEPLASGEFTDRSADNPEIMIWERLLQAGLAIRTEAGYRFMD